MLKDIRFFLYKVKVLYFGLFKSEGMFTKTCGKCRWMFFDKLEITNDGEIYDAKFKCRRCGAIGIIHEEWI